MEANQVSIDGWMEKQNVVHAYNRIFSFREEWNCDTNLKDKNWLCRLLPLPLHPWFNLWIPNELYNHETVILDNAQIHRQIKASTYFTSKVFTFAKGINRCFYVPRLMVKELFFSLHLHYDLMVSWFYLIYLCTLQYV